MRLASILPSSLLRRVSAWVPLLVGLAPVLGAAQQPVLEEGSLAAAGTWTTAGGSPARSGRSRSAPLRGEPEALWNFQARGEITDEPLLWNERLVVTATSRAGLATVHVLDTRTGRQLATASVPSSAPLQPSLWGDLLLLRPSLERLELFRIGSRIQSLRAIAGREITGAVLFEDELIYVDGGTITRLDVQRREPVWSKAIRGTFRGRPALRGDHVHAVWYDEAGNGHLAIVARSDGTLVQDLTFGGHGGRVPAAEDPLDLHVFEDELFCRLPLPLVQPSGAQRSTLRIGRADGERGAGSSSLHALRNAPLEWSTSGAARGWIAREGPEKTAASWLASRTEGQNTRSILLASEANHSRLLSFEAPASAAGTTVYLGDLAVDAEDFSIAWRSEHAPRLRPVPDDERVYVVVGSKDVVALGAPGRRATAAEQEAERTLARVDAAWGESLAALALRAVRVSALDLAHSLLAEAAAAGATERSLRRAGDAVASATTRAVTRSRGDADARSQRGAQALLAEKERLRESRDAKLLEHAAEARDAELQRLLLAELVERSPGDEVGALVQRLLPGDAPLSPSTSGGLANAVEARRWLTFLAVHRASPVGFVAPDPNAPEARRAGTLQHLLVQEQRAWRADVHGFQSEGLFVLAPRSRPAAVARCLQVGRLVCRALEELFDTRARPSDDELVLLLYESKREYQLQSQRENSSPELARGWTGGHYSPSENLSRMYIPPEELPDRLLGVYAHELTHHWLATRAPFVRGTGGTNRANGTSYRARADAEGYWIAEGFATMVEEFRFFPDDGPNGRFETENPSANSLDVVGNVPAAKRISWERFFALSQEAFHELDATPSVPVALTWRLGARANLSPIRLFYAQAGATCHFLLHGEGGRHRPALLRSIEAWTRGQSVRLPEMLGLSADELGRRIVTHARSVVDGA